MAVLASLRRHAVLWFLTTLVALAVACAPGGQASSGLRAMRLAEVGLATQVSPTSDVTPIPADPSPEAVADPTVLPPTATLQVVLVAPGQDSLRVEEVTLTREEPGATDEESPSSTPSPAVPPVAVSSSSTPASTAVPAESATEYSPPQPTPTPPALVIRKRPANREVLPVRLRIPALGVDAHVVVRGVDDEGVLEVPDNPYDVAWYDFTALPGRPGNAVFAGHRDWAKVLGVFWDLGKLEPGDEAYVYRGDETEYRYVVESSVLYEDEDAPVEEVLGPTAEPVITLITCEGPFSSADRNYAQRRVVRAKLQEEES